MMLHQTPSPTSPPAKAASANSPADAVPSFEAMLETVSQPTWYDRMFAEDAAWAVWLTDFCERIGRGIVWAGIGAGVLALAWMGGSLVWSAL